MFVLNKIEKNIDIFLEKNSLSIWNGFMIFKQKISIVMHSWFQNDFIESVYRENRNLNFYQIIPSW